MKYQYRPTYNSSWKEIKQNIFPGRCDLGAMFYCSMGLFTKKMKEYVPLHVCN